MKPFNISAVFSRLVVIAIAGLFSSLVQAHPQHAGAGVQHEEDIVKHATTEPCSSQDATAAGKLEHQRTAPCGTIIMADPDNRN